MATDSPLLTLKEAAIYLGYTVRALRYHMNESGHLQADGKQGRQVVFQRGTLDAFAARQRQSGVGKTKPGNTAEVARHFGVNVDTVRGWVLAGHFPGARRLGRYWYIPPKDVAKFNPPGSGRRPENSSNIHRKNT